jgi:hypothetical protein
MSARVSLGTHQTTALFEPTAPKAIMAVALRQTPAFAYPHKHGSANIQLSAQDTRIANARPCTTGVYLRAS